MECATVLCSMDDGYATMLQEKIVKAIKPHKCCECRMVINPGEKYNIEVTVYDGDISRYKTCLDCMSLREVFFKEGFYFEMTKEMLWEHVMDCHGDISESSLKGLTPGARSMVCGIIEEAWERYDDDEDNHGR